MEEAEILELYELSYSDLVLLSARGDAFSSSLSCSSEEQRRLEAMRRSIMETLGPAGPGLLSVTAVPKSSLLRRKLLPLARKLALLNPEYRKSILKEHKLGSDVPLKNPDRNVSSFAMQLQYSQSHESSTAMHSIHDYLNSEPHDLDADRTRELQDNEFKSLGSTFKGLGFCMMELGLRLAQICDGVIGGRELEQCLLESCAAKGRLIHYHSAQDKLVLKQASRRKGSVKRMTNSRGDQENSVKGEKIQSKGHNLNLNGSGARSCGIDSNLWQQWHYDYGIFTVLTDPMFLLPSSSSSTMVDNQFPPSGDQECASPSGHSYLQIYHPSINKVLMVKLSPESFIIQVGESADILSKGKLRSTLHCVCRPKKMEKLCRETFVVFLQPAWSKTFSILDYPMEHVESGAQHSGMSDEESQLAEQAPDELAKEIRQIVPPLSLRLKDGMSFAEFSRQTTKQYYGGGGLQSNR